ncbi:MAG: hypothetical protein V2B19_31475 [Pseudomonadota bacterium]
MGYWQFPKYVSVAEKRLKAEKKRKQLLKKNPKLCPVEIDGSALATSWWGKSWDKNLERYADYENRIGRGRSYVRHGAVLDLQIAPGEVTALVQGSRSAPYEITVKIKTISAENWRQIKKACEGKFDSLKTLLTGKFPKDLEMLFTEKGKGLFPTPDEIKFSCSCPDWASMCKHVAATLYGIGARLDEDPLLFFKLRNVAVEDLVSQAVTESSRDLLRKAEKKTGRVLEDANLSDMFGIDLDSTDDSDTPGEVGLKKSVAKSRKVVPLTGKKKTATAIPHKVLKKVVLEEEKATRIKKKTSVAKTTALSDIDRLENILNSRKEGITTAVLAAEAGLDATRVRYLISRLKSQGKIITIERGRYAGTMPAKKKPGTSDSAYLQEIIWKSGQKVTIADLIQKTGFDEERVRNSIIRLMAQGKIKALSRNVFKKA